MSPVSSASRRPRAGRTACALALALAFGASAALVPPAHAVRFMNHNLLNWSGTSGVARVPYMRAITRGVAPDLIVVQEMIDSSGVNLYLNQVLDFREPGQWAAAPFTNGPDTDNALFYRPSKLVLLDVVEVPTALRNASRYHLRLAGYPAGAESEFYLYSMHLKASNTTTDAQLRLAEMQIIRANAETLPIGSHVLFCGDYNVYSGFEAAFQHALSSIGNNVGRMRDPIGQVAAWSNNGAYAAIHTQSPRTASFGGGATGGMDDRFDFILTSYNWDDGLGMDLLGNTYTAYGNDGQHFNLAIDGNGFNNAVGVAMADSIEQAADHIPVFADVRVPSRLSLPLAALDFGTVITGAVATANLPVENPAATPGDALDYTFDPPAGFTAPNGAFALAAGAATAHAIGMDTAAPGAMAGDLGIFTDAPGLAYVTVPLSGTVLAHAVPSSDSALVVLADTLDFGTQEAGGFSDRTAHVWNTGYSPLQAPLQVAGAAIIGGDGRFALSEPFAAQLVTDGAAAYAVAFDDAGATAESTYTASLTFTTADAPALPGAIARADVAYALLARLSNPLVDADGPVEARIPTVTVLFAPNPNPVTAPRTTLRFDLASPGRVTLAIYDVRGRHVATLLDTERAAGTHAVSWDGRESGGRDAANGVYFAELRTADGTGSSRRFVILR